METMRANADQEANTEVPKAPPQYEHRNLWTLKLVKIFLKLVIQLYAIRLRDLKPTSRLPQ